MNHWMIGAVLGLLALPGTAVQAQDREESVSAPRLSLWGTGDGAYSYHLLSGDCETIDHGHGRNAAWGRWIMPLSATVVDGPGEDEVGNLVLRFRCADGTACIQSGYLTETTDRVSDHGIPFETIERARAFERQVADLKIACGVTD